MRLCACPMGFDADAHNSRNPKLIQISSFVPTDENNSISDLGCVFRLQPGEVYIYATIPSHNLTGLICYRMVQTLVLAGTYQLVVVKGSISVSGAKLSHNSPPHIVHAPMTHSLPIIEVLSSKRQTSTCTEVLVTTFHSSLLDIGKLCPTFNSIWKGTPKSTAATEHTFAPIYASAANIPTISILPSWKPTLKALVRRATDVDAPPPTILLAGPKGAGKSTLSRILVNRLLTTSDLDAVAYLDVDPGQPEFSPPGTISLSLVHNPVLGPPFTHSPSPTRCHHIGYNSPREDPGHYMRAIIDLLSVHRQSHPAVPLLINTAGWIKGLGLELLQDIVANSQATDVVFLGSGGQAVAEIIPPKTAVLHELASAALSSPTRFTSADLRTLHTMAYFHRFSCGRQGPDFSTPLTGFAPWVIPYTGADRGVDAVHILGETTIASDELRTAIEGTIVGIVVVAEHDLPESFTPISIPSATATTATTAGCKGGELLPPILETALSPQVADCKGLGVIRAIDAANGHIHLVSPIAEAEIEGWERQGKRVVLARGRLELPVWEMLLPRLAGGSANKIGGRQPQQQGDGEEEEELPWISTGEGKRVGRGAVWRVRRNVMRRGQQ